MQVKDSVRSRRDLGSLALICVFLQVAIAPNIGLGNGRANMGLVFAGIVSLLVGGRVGVLAGFAAGLVFDLSTTGPIGLMAFLLTGASYLVGSETRNRLADDFTGSMRIFSGMALVVSLLYHVTMLLVGDSNSIINAIFFRAIPTTLLTVVAFAPFAYIISHATGAPLSLGRKPSRSARARGSHYDLDGV